MTGTLGHLAAALAVFMLSHLIPGLPPLRRAAMRVLGRPGYFFGYGILSLAILAWVVAAYAAAPYVEVWPPSPVRALVPLLAMPFATVLVVAGMTTPNPFSLGPGGRGYDPARPGILRLTRHPVLWGVTVWTVAHIAPNGDVAALLLFGLLLGLCIFGLPLAELRSRRGLGPAWAELAANTGRPATLRLAEVGWGRIAAGLGLYGLLILLHPLVLGVPALPAW